MAQRPLITALLIDLSGTVHVGSQPTPGAVEAIAKLRHHGVPFRFCSNTSKESTAAAKRRLMEMGIEVGDIDDDGGIEELWTSIGAVKRYLQSLGVRRPYLLLSDSAKEEIESSPPYDDDHDFDAVVVGLAPSHFDYHHLNTAFRILTGEHRRHHTSRLPAPAPASPNDSYRNGNGSNGLLETIVPIPLIATHKAKYLESASPPGLSLGPGPFIAALEYAAGVQAHVLGKPTKEFFGAVIDSFPQNVHKAMGRIAIVGDDVEADLGGGAIELGLWRVLVRTGKYRPGDEHKLGVAPPDEVYDSLDLELRRLNERTSLGAYFNVDGDGVKECNVAFRRHIPVMLRLSSDSTADAAIISRSGSSFRIDGVLGRRLRVLCTVYGNSSDSIDNVPTQSIQNAPTVT